MTNLIDLIREVPTPFNMIVLIALIASVSGIIVAIAKGIQHYLCLRQELDFKREMIDRGMSAEEIERLVKARSPSQSGENI
jgi:hypothetical protein